MKYLVFESTRLHFAKGMQLCLAWSENLLHTTVF